MSIKSLVYKVIGLSVYNKYVYSIIKFHKNNKKVLEWRRTFENIDSIKKL